MQSAASFKSRLSCALGALTLGAAAPVSAFAQDSAAAHGADPDWALIENVCLDCHNFVDWAGGLALDTMDFDSMAEDAHVWEDVLRKLRGRLMPPPGEAQPDEAERHAFIQAMEARLDRIAQDSPHAGYVALHRLNRAEYANAVRDLFDLQIDARALLPTDNRSGGFENVASVLQVSPTFLDQYIAAARQISLLAVGDPQPVLTSAIYPVPQHINHTVHVEGLPLGTRGGVSTVHHFPSTGEYSFTIPMSSKDGSLLRSYPMGWLEYEHTFVLSIDDVPVFEASLGGAHDLRSVDQHQQSAVEAIQARFADIRLPVEAGPRRVSATFIARTFAESDDLLFSLQPGELLDDIPVVTRLEVLGPFDPRVAEDTPSRRKIFSCYPEADSEARPCAESIMARLASQAYRRPAGHADVQTLMGFYDAGYEIGGFETGVQRAIMAMLSSTNFLYRRETPPADVAPGETFALSDTELASRLAFFLWSQGPDAELIALAQSGELSDPDVRAAQVRRMLDDPRSRSLVTNFAFQWLDIERAHLVDPDPRLFPEFDPDLRDSFMRELELFIGSVLREDESVVRLLDADHTFVNERLARHYGMKDVRGSGFRRVTLDDTARHGLLGKGGILLQTSYPNRTSPVLRGAWIMEVLLGAPPSAPPPGVETDLSIVDPNQQASTVRARLEQHRDDPSCAGCHGVIDPLGLALENFDAVGAWRDRDRYVGEMIDAAGELAGGYPVSGPDDLRVALAAEPEQYVQTFAEKLLTFALGRRLQHFDMPVVRDIVRRSAEDDYRFSALVMAVVESAPFGMKTLPAETERATLTDEADAEQAG